MLAMCLGHLGTNVWHPASVLWLGNRLQMTQVNAVPVSAPSIINMIEHKPFGRKSSGFKYVYHLTFEVLDASDMARLDHFCRRLLGALHAWSSEEVVELVARVRNLEEEIHCT